MAGEMEVAGHSIDFEPAFHPASVIRVEIFLNSQFFLVTVSCLDKAVFPRQIILENILHDIDLVHFQNVLHVETEHGAGVLRETDINIDS